MRAIFAIFGKVRRFSEDDKQPSSNIFGNFAPFMQVSWLMDNGVKYTLGTRSYRWLAVIPSGNAGQHLKRSFSVIRRVSEGLPRLRVGLPCGNRQIASTNTPWRYHRRHTRAHKYTLTTKPTSSGKRSRRSNPAIIAISNMEYESLNCQRTAFGCNQRET